MMTLERAGSQSLYMTMKAMAAKAVSLAGAPFNQWAVHVLCEGGSNHVYVTKREDAFADLDENFAPLRAEFERTLAEDPEAVAVLFDTNAIGDGEGTGLTFIHLAVVPVDASPETPINAPGGVS